MQPSQSALEASVFSIVALFDRQVCARSDSVAVQSTRLTLTYRELDRRASRLAGWLADAGVRAGERVCILSENDPDFLVLSIAALRLRVTVATLNPRLATKELLHCIRLVTPRLVLVSVRQRERLGHEFALLADIRDFGGGTPLDRMLSQADVIEPPAPAFANRADPEFIQFIMYTSGTTGLPKAAMVSQRAMLARINVYVLDYGVDGGDTFLAWSPLCHMASIELGFGTLLLGGKVVVLDGADLPVICDYLERERLSNLIFFPGMVADAISYLEKRRPKVRSLKKFGALADLFRPRDIANLTTLLGTPFTNTFGSTETGMPPLSAGRLAIGVEPRDLGKSPSALCEVRIIDEAGQTCPPGVVGELVVRGPTVFSGYWADEGATASSLAGGWFHTGDLFRAREDGRFDYVDRRKYLIKSGGENIYPAEIERIVLQHPDIVDAIVVRRADDCWGEVPVLVAVARGRPPTAAEIDDLCRRELAGFKRPKAVHFVDAASLPRSATGKIVRAEVEAWVAARGAARTSDS
jgi:fatty-acyl-CoA synthase